MDEQEYLYMYEEEERHWWYAGMRSIVSSLLPPKALPTNAMVLDAGCGTGYNMEWLQQQYGATVTGLDFSTQALNFCRRRGGQVLVQADAASIPLRGCSFDLVISFDVLTQLKTGNARTSALCEFLRVLKPGGRLLLRVAAYEFLRSSHDTAVMTYHRYGKGELSRDVSKAGFRVRRVTGANTILFPVAFLWRMLKRAGLAPEGSDVRSRTRGGEGVNRAATSVLRFEAAALRRVDFPFGVSILLLAEKPDHPE
jgi:SAM-dependent methyltransferase